MYLRELFIENFKSFYGKHVFQFVKGLNVIQRTCGSSRIDLVDAIEFGLFGALHRPKGGNASTLINDDHLDECSKKYGFGDCNVEMTYVFDDKLHRIDRNLSYFLEDRIREKLSYSDNLKQPITRDVFHNSVCFSCGCSQHSSFDSDEFSSSVEKKVSFLERLIEENISGCLGMLILDNLFEGLCKTRRIDFIRKIVSSDLEQVLLFINPSEVDIFDLRRLVSSIFLLEEMEVLRVKVDNFPFATSELRHDLEWNYDGKYIRKGGIDRLEVYGHEFTIKIVKAKPNGSRFDREKTKMIVE